MSNTGLKNVAKITRLNYSGSMDINTKNEFGVHVFAGTVEDDGIVFGKLTKPNYNTGELQKTIDTSIYELVPKKAVIRPDMILLSIFQAEVGRHAESKRIIATRDITISNLQNTINILNTTVESLNVQLDAQSLIAANAQNQSQQAMTRVTTNIVELQNAVQKSISEVIGRVSAEVRNKSLEDDNNSLKDQLYGRSAKLQEGYQLGNDFAVKVLNKSDSTHAGLVYRYKSENLTGNMTEQQWLNGPEVEIANYSDVSTTFTITSKVPFSSIGSTVNGKVTISAQSAKTITFNADDTGIHDAGYHNDTDTEWDGYISIKSGKTSNVVSLQIALQDQYAGAFGPNPTIKTIS